MNKKQQPVNLALTTINFSPMAIASIFHRLSGIFIFLLIPFLLSALACSLKSSESFGQLTTWLAQPPIKLIIWIFLTALFYHLVAGIRHMVMDCGIAETLPIAKYSAIAVIVLGFIWAVFWGVWLW